MSSLVPKVDIKEPLADDLVDLLRQLDAVDADTANLLEGLTEDQFHWSPTSSRWSIAQCLVHLVIVARRYLPIVDECIDRTRPLDQPRRGPFRHNLFERWIVRITEPPPSIRLRTPASARPPDDQPLPGVVANFLAVQEELRKRVRAANGVDLAHPKLAAPFSRGFRIGLGAFMAFIVAHERRHLWQAWQVRAHENFPPD